ncbi:Retrovirus-related Pol polyprotein from transposon TNT 1-94, partial [Glycine soja]
MQSYMESLDLWDVVEEDYEIYPLPENPTMAQIKNHKERKTNKAKARSCLFTGISQMIFIRIMTLKSPKAIWDYLKEEYAGDDRIRSMQVLNLRREFELQRMEESDTIKEYSNKLLGIANKIKLLGSDFADSRIVEKILVTVPEITLAEVLHALQAQEQRRLMRQDRVVNGVLPAKHHEVDESKKDFIKKNQLASNENCANNQNKGHAPFRCWRRPDAKCNKCNQIGHEAVICPNKNHHDEGAQIANQEEEDQLFVATCFLSSESSESWLIDSGCTNHMTYDKTLFKDLKPTSISKVRIGKGGYILVKEKGIVAISTCLSTKLISDVLYVPNIDQNLLSVGQLIKKGFKVSFEHQHCFIYDNFGREVLRVKMKGKSF